ncbi:NAD(P)H-binding protein [Xylocopilactobacillus apicola]|uniref:NAD-dependent dehydratase n=1 Tax=Xylocopilactobacillus apicola TaxID=2932184 RepID=A0AAU9D978_9LACO|nr:NAD(P)H-binding protein [Xylocopilactobacillus apicola]BDR58910.1 NAD-dependent dehydratase [Xylocopilactobacillus apicola]
MKTVLILGANGATAQIVTMRLLAETTFDLRLYLRNAERLAQFNNEPRIQLIEGDILDDQSLNKAMTKVDLVYSNLGGVDLANLTTQVLKTMKENNCERLLFYSALGALHEVPGKFGAWNEQAIAAYLPGFRASDELIRNESGINTTQFRPAWLTNKKEVNYEVTLEGESFQGTEISRASVADFIVKLIKDPTLYPNTSVGLDQPGTDGDYPEWLKE